jgi:hypothetical protein
MIVKKPCWLRVRTKKISHRGTEETQNFVPWCEIEERLETMVSDAKF